MIYLNNMVIHEESFPDGTLRLNLPDISKEKKIYLYWEYENEVEQIILFQITRALQSQKKINNITLILPYLPNARMDRIYNSSEVFTLKYFCELINNLNFTEVYLLDVHSNVGAALINRAINLSPEEYIRKTMENFNINLNEDYLFFPDEGSQKRYCTYFPEAKHVGFGLKKRDWETGKILGLEVIGDDPKGRNVFIVDDICSYGGTVYYSSQKLKSMGCSNIYLYITHCENSILEGKLIGSGLLSGIGTTNSIFTKQHKLIKIIEINKIN